MLEEGEGCRRKEKGDEEKGRELSNVIKCAPFLCKLMRRYDLHIKIDMFVLSSGSSAYSSSECPICYSPAINVPEECQGISAEEVAAKTEGNTLKP